MSPELQCARCSNYLFDGPIQCSCGDRLCYPCYSSLSKNVAAFKCVKCKIEVYVDDCFKDRAVTNDLKKATLECISQGCSWKGNSNEYQQHIETCAFGLVKCKNHQYGCAEEIPRSDQSIHEAECPFKPTKCRYCGKNVHNEKTHLLDECQSAPLHCGNGCGVSLPRKELEKHTRTTCTRKLKECEFKEAGCQYLGHDKGLEEHYATNTKKHLQLTKNSIQRIDKAMEAKIMMLSEQISDLNTEIHHVNREISVQLQPVASAVGKAENAIQNLQEGFSELALMVQTLQAKSYNGSFIWKIPEVQHRRHEAKIGKTISLYSAPFYTGRQGYKACLGLYMNGDGCGKNTHLSFFVTIMKGEYDALLQWPFRHTVTLTLLDQDGVNNISQAFQPEPTSSSFQRPRNEMNIAYGCPMFAPLSILNNSSYVKEDIMFLKCDTTRIQLL